MESKAIYTVVVNGKPEGPYSIEELKNLSIHPETFIKTPEMDDYQEAHAIPQLRALLGFTFTSALPQYFAAFDLRLLAAIIDYFMIIMVCTAVALILFFGIKETELRMTMLIAIGVLIPVLKFLYGCYGDASPHQGTIGKRLANIKVTDMQGRRISLLTSVWRNLAKLSSTMPLFFGYLFSFLNKKHQCFHDIIANTLVVKDRLI